MDYPEIKPIIPSEQDEAFVRHLAFLRMNFEWSCAVPWHLLDSRSGSYALAVENEGFFRVRCGTYKQEGS